jgi:hypothetical protein
MSAVKRAEFVNDRMSYIILKGHWCRIIVLNMLASAEDKLLVCRTACMRKWNVCLINYLNTI